MAQPAASNNADPPALWIIAGANGSGKSSAYSQLLIQAPRGAVWIINPDELAKRIHIQEELDLPEANLQAVRRIEGWLRASVRAHQTVGVETVLSTSKYRTLVRYAKRYGFRVRLVYVALETAQLNIDRVRIRVAKGGHAVDEAKIVARRVRSFEQLPWFLAHADTAQIFDNSGCAPRLIATKEAGAIETFGPAFPELTIAIKRAADGDL